MYLKIILRMGKDGVSRGVVPESTTIMETVESKSVIPLNWKETPSTIYKSYHPDDDEDYSPSNR